MYHKVAQEAAGRVNWTNVAAGLAVTLGAASIGGHTEGFQQEVGLVEFYADDDIPQMERPDVTVHRMTALAVGQITGVVPLDASYEGGGPGAVNCDFNTNTDIEFEAEVMMQMGDVTVEAAAPGPDGKYDATVTVEGGAELLNPRVTGVTIDYDSEGIGSCSDGTVTDFLNNTFDVGQDAAATAGECLTARTADTGKAEEIKQVYADSLREDLAALMPNANISEIVLPDTFSDETPYLDKLNDTVERIEEDNNYNIDVSAYTSCEFAELTVDTGFSA